MLLNLDQATSLTVGGGGGGLLTERSFRWKLTTVSKLKNGDKIPGQTSKLTTII